MWSTWEAYKERVRPELVDEETFDDFVTRPVALRLNSLGTISGLILTAGHGVWTMATHLLDTSQEAARAPKSFTPEEWAAKFSRSIANSHEGLKSAFASALKLTEYLLAFDGSRSRSLELLRLLRENRDWHASGDFERLRKGCSDISSLAATLSEDIVDTIMERASKLDREVCLANSPDDLDRYVVEVRDVLLCEHYELAALAGCRTLERSLRTVAAEHCLMLETRGVAGKLAEEDLIHVIEALYRARWNDGTRVLSKEQHALLQFVRTMRNASAHAANVSGDVWRQVAVIAVRTAIDVLSRSRAPTETVAPTTIARQW